jgi:hypothetical protein
MNDLILSALARERSECLQRQARQARSLRTGAARPPRLRALFACALAWVGGACYKLSDALSER